jgi:hypothetical protein
MEVEVVELEVHKVLQEEQEVLVVVVKEVLVQQDKMEIQQL